MNEAAGHCQAGVSVVICCHNSAARLGETLQCLAQQEGTDGIAWEVLVIDNGSTDGTAQVAQASWPSPPPAPLRVISEPMLGLPNARIRGFDSASYEFVSFVDDDNRVASDWIKQVNRRMSSDSAIGACGANITADFESGSPPAWWDEFAGCFAVGRQWPEEGDVTCTKGWLYGAGLTIRKTAWEQLRAGGFRFYSPGRRGQAVSGGEDNEICFALCLSGWTLWLDWSLRIRHFMPRGRVSWNYVRRLYRGAGGSALAYCCYDASQPAGWKDRLRMHWWWQAMGTVKQLLLHPLDYWAYAVSKREGDPATLRTEARLGRLSELLRLRGQYRTMLIAILNAPWRRRAPIVPEAELISAGI